ncbi:Calmodulin-like protein 5 [Striga hermonthica]|uniref:Calmodulin-like protein 5 n=1 Tax=Striga hermonthica TaxID=68872 RepID=A0A9N7RL71_STRHE|nr:Calmodulin-like protein 5 [Striga hermonthica]
MGTVELHRLFSMLDERQWQHQREGALGICVSEEKLRPMIGKVDADGDADEFGARYATTLENGEGDKGDDGEEDVREAFRVFDREGADSSQRMN